MSREPTEERKRSVLPDDLDPFTATHPSDTRDQASLRIPEVGGRVGSGGSLGAAHPGELDQRTRRFPDWRRALSRSAGHAIVLPDMSGRGLATQLLDERPGLKVVYTSGYTDDRVMHDAMSDGGLRFVQKLFTPPALLTKIRDVLDADGDRG